MTELTDAELVEDVKRRLAPFMADGLRQSDIAERLSEIAGQKVDQSTVSKWFSEGVKRGLHSHTRKALSHMRQELIAGVWPNGKGERDPYDAEREAEDLDRAGKSLDPLIRIMERDSIAAVIRAQAVRETAWATRLAEQNVAARMRDYPPGDIAPVESADRPGDGELDQTGT